MGQKIASSFEHSSLEADIERLSVVVNERMGESESPKDAVKKAVREVYIDPSVTSGQAPSGDSGVLPKYLKDSPADVKLFVEKAIDLVWHKGISTGAKEASKHGPLVLDAFHDALTDKLYEELKKRKHI
jgi:hypothetical protein